MNTEKLDPKNESLMNAHAKTIGGTIGLVFIVTLGFGASDWVMTVMENRGAWIVFSYLGAGLVMSIFFVVAGLGLSFLSDHKVPILMRIQLNNLRETTSGLVDASKSLGDASDIIKELQANLQNIGQVVLLDDFDKLQSSFMSATDLSKPDVSKPDKVSKKKLRIVGTMLGTYGQKSLGLADHLVTLCRETKEAPFEEAYLGVPGHEKGKGGGDGLRSLYPFSARVAAGKILVEVSRAVQKHSAALHPTGLKIHIKFLKQDDVFPAIQVWDQECAMILCSAGAEDRKDNGGSHAVFKAMPVALMLKEKNILTGCGEHPLFVSNTLKRIREHLENDYDLNSYSETWTLESEGDHVKVDKYL